MIVLKENISSLLLNELNNNANKIMLIKNNGKFNLEKFYSYALEIDNKKQYVFKKLKKGIVSDPFGPLFTWIKEKFLEEKDSLDSIFEKLNIYPTHRNIIKSYINTGIVKRDEDLLYVDYKYEKHKMYESILKIYNYYSRDKELWLLLENLNFASYSTIKWLSWFLKQNIDCNFKILATVSSFKYSDSKYQNKFDELLQDLEFNNSVLQFDDLSDNSDDEELNVIDSSYDLTTLGENFFYFFTFEESEKFFKQRYKELIKKDTINNDSSTDADELAHVLIRLGDINLFMNNLEAAYTYYNLLFNQLVNNQKIKAYAFQRLSLLNIAKIKYSAAEKQAKLSYKIADSLNDDLLKFKAYSLFFWINKTGEYKTTIGSFAYQDEMIEIAKKYNQYNMLAYFLTHSFSESSPNSNYYYEGHALAEKLDNKNCVLSAHLNTALLYSVAGEFNISILYYKKVETLLTELGDNFRLAQTYNGMGYYYMNGEQFVRANYYYDKALKLLRLNWNFDEICVTLLNKALNALLAYDYETSEKCSNILLSVISVLKLDRLRMTTIDRIYGIVSLINFYIGNIYKSYSFVSKIHIDKDILSNHEHDDESFLYNFVQGLLFRHEGRSEESLKYFSKANEYMSFIKGSLQCLYPKFILEYSITLASVGKILESGSLRSKGINYCLERDHKFYLSILNSKPPVKHGLGSNLSNLSWVIEAAKQQNTIDSLNNKMNEINFYRLYQEILSSGYDKDKVVASSIDLLHNRFSLDYSLLVFHEDSTNTVVYSHNNIELSNEDLFNYTKIIKSIKEPYVTGENVVNLKLRNFFQRIIDNKIQSLICIPIINDNKLTASFICLTKIDTTLINSKIVLDEDNLKTISLIVKQFIETLKRIEGQEKLLRIASTDMLTGLYNRQSFFSTINKLIENQQNYTEKKPICLFYIDLDNFKYYNDTFGHNIGDSVLIWFSEILQSLVGKDDFAIRYGGDEFLLFFNNCTLEKAKSIGDKLYEKLESVEGFKEKICDFLEKDIEIPNDKLLSCSIGITEDTLSRDLDVIKLVDKADKSLYTAKKSGKHHYVINRN